MKYRLTERLELVVPTKTGVEALDIRYWPLVPIDCSLNQENKRIETWRKLLLHYCTSDDPKNYKIVEISNSGFELEVLNRKEVLREVDLRYHKWNNGRSYSKETYVEKCASAVLDDVMGGNIGHRQSVIPSCYHGWPGTKTTDFLITSSDLKKLENELGIRFILPTDNEGKLYSDIISLGLDKHRTFKLELHLDISGVSKQRSLLSDYRQSYFCGNVIRSVIPEKPSYLDPELELSMAISKCTDKRNVLNHSITPSKLVPGQVYLYQCCSDYQYNSSTFKEGLGNWWGIRELERGLIYLYLGKVETAISSPITTYSTYSSDPPERITLIAEFLSSVYRQAYTGKYVTADFICMSPDNPKYDKRSCHLIVCIEPLEFMKYLRKHGGKVEETELLTEILSGNEFYNKIVCLSRFPKSSHFVPLDDIPEFSESVLTDEISVSRFPEVVESLAGSLSRKELEQTEIPGYALLITKNRDTQESKEIAKVIVEKIDTAHSLAGATFPRSALDCKEKLKEWYQL